jgi:uncharacterized protein involved in propanediol utilization
MRDDPPPASDAAALRVAGHFGELVQGRLGPGGPVALISLPCPLPAVEIGSGAGPLPPGGAALMAALGLPAPAGVGVRALMPPGGGAGTSTAALVGLARLAGWAGPPEALARACVAAEGASDPLMFERPERLVFASRRGVVLARLPAMARIAVVGGFLGPEAETDPDDDRFPDVADLIAAWPGACGTVDRVARIAAASARRTVALRGPAGDPTAALATELGAAGWAIAHTGSARALIFAPGRVPAGAGGQLEAAGFRQVVAFEAGG